MLSGKRILIVEDEPIIALDLAAAVVDGEGTVVGTAVTVEQAHRLLASEPCDAVILDLRLKDGLATAIADRLRDLGIPFVIHSGQADSICATAWPGVPVVGKPALPEQVMATLVCAMGAR